MVKEEIIGQGSATKTEGQERRGSKAWWLQDAINSIANLSTAYQLRGVITAAEAKQELAAFEARLNAKRGTPDYGNITGATYDDIIADAKRSNLQDIQQVNRIAERIQKLTNY